MRWFKHLSLATEDEKLAEILELYGAEGYGVYWIILEKIAFLMDGTSKTSARYSLKKWSKFCGKSPKVFRKFLESFEKLSLFFVEISGKDSEFLIIDCPNLLKYRDEYSKKSGQTPDKIKSASGQTPDQDRETETETETETEINKNLFVEDSKEFQLAFYFYQEILKNKPDLKKPNLQTWSKDIDLLLRRDKRDPEKVRELIKKCQTDDFEMSNVLSPSKLRKRYDQLEMKFGKNSPKGRDKPKPGQSLHDFILEQDAEEQTIILSKDDYEPV